MHFLIIDDDQAILTLLENVIYRLGHDFTSVMTEEAARLAKDTPFDGVIIDWHLGDKTSEPLTRSLKQSHPDAMFMMITGDSDLDLIQSALSLGVNDWWFKPTGVANLKAQIQSMIQNARHQVPLAKSSNQAA